MAAPRTGASRLQLGALRYPRYRLYWAGQLVTNVGSWMQVVASGWLLLQLTDSPASLGLNGGFLAVPLIVFSLLGGVIADRLDRYRLLVGTQLAQVAPDVALAALVGTGAVQPAHIYVYSLVWGTIRGLSFPARQALIPRLVPEEALQSATALSTILWQGAGVVGPLVAGLALQQWGMASPFYLNVASDALYLATLLLLRLSAQPAQSAERSVWECLVEGAHYAWNQPRIHALLVVVAGISFFDRSYTQLMPVFARDVFGVGAGGLGLLLAMPAVGTIVAALTLSAAGRLPHRGRWVLAAAATLGLALVYFAASSHLWLALALLLVVGAANTVAVALINTLLQQNVADEMRGRVMSFYMDATQGGAYLGALPVGVLAQAWGAPLAVNLSAAASLLLVVVFSLRSNALRRLN